MGRKNAKRTFATSQVKFPVLEWCSDHLVTIFFVVTLMTGLG